MKKRLRLLAWMLTLTMLCELLPFGAFAQSDVGQSSRLPLHRASRRKMARLPSSANAAIIFSGLCPATVF